MRLKRLVVVKLKKVEVKTKNNKTVKVNCVEVELAGRTVTIRQLLFSDSLELEECKNNQDRIKKQIALSIHDSDLTYPQKEDFFYELTNSDAVKLLKAIKDVNGLGGENPFT